MQKKLIALAVAGLVSGGAFAQSNVTIYGVADVGVANINTGNGSHTQIQSGQNAGSRLGFKGEEALGNGLKAIFQLEAGLTLDNGNAGGSAQGYGANQGSTSSAYGNNATNAATAQGSMLFGRQAFAGISSATLGTITIGRQYSPMYAIYAATDAFGLGTGATYFNAAGQVPGYATRLNNSVVYATPSFAGFSGAVAYSAGAENNVDGKVASSVSDKGGQAWGVNGKYENGPLFVGAAFHQVYGIETLNAGATNDIKKSKGWTLGASYDFGVVKAFANYADGKTENRDTAAADTKRRAYHVGATVPFGAHAVTVGYNRLDDRTEGAAGDNDFTSYGARYTYALSKRTLAYTAYTRGTNKGAATYTLSGAADSTGLVNAGYDPRRIEFGVQHSF